MNRFDLKEQQLNIVFNEIHKKYFQHSNRTIIVVFHPYRTLRHTVEWNQKKISAKVSHHFKHAPVEIIRIIAILLLAKVYRYKIERKLRRIYREYVTSLQINNPQTKTKSNSHYFSKEN